MRKRKKREIGEWEWGREFKGKRVCKRKRERGEEILESGSGKDSVRVCVRERERWGKIGWRVGVGKRVSGILCV